MRSRMTGRGGVILVVATMAISTTALAQTQNSGSIWQKIKNSAKQAGQNTSQQGAQQVQQGVGNLGNQVTGVQASPWGNLAQASGANGGTLTNASFNGAGGGTSGAGSCGQNCFNAGPFAAAVSQMTMSQQGAWHIIRMELQFHNATNQPLAIAYHDGSMVLVDDLGNTYQGAGGNPGEVQGMGIDRGNQTDSQFVLGPGQTSSALFSVARYRSNTSAIGSAFNYNFTIDELQAQNGADALVARQYNLNFPNLVAGATGGAFPGTPTNGFVAGSAGAPSATGAAVNNPASVAGSRTGLPAAKQSAVAPAQRNAVNARSGLAAAGTTANRAAQPISNAALRSTTAGSTTAAAAAKPAPAAKPVAAKAPVKKVTNINPAGNK